MRKTGNGSRAAGQLSRCLVGSGRPGNSSKLSWMEPDDKSGSGVRMEPIIGGNCLAFCVGLFVQF